VKVAAEIDWAKPKPKNVGRGLAVIAKSPTTHSSISGAHVLFNEDGSAQVMVGASELGQGMCGVMSQIAAEVLGIGVGSGGHYLRRYCGDPIRPRHVLKPGDLLHGNGSEESC